MFASLKRVVLGIPGKAEQAAARWWDRTLRSPKTLGRLGTVLNDACAARERGDRALEDVWNAWRVPSAADAERIHERLGELGAQLDRVESLLSRETTRA